MTLNTMHEHKKPNRPNTSASCSTCQSHLNTRHNTSTYTSSFIINPSSFTLHFFFFNDPATPKIYPLPQPNPLPISSPRNPPAPPLPRSPVTHHPSSYSASATPSDFSLP